MASHEARLKRLEKKAVKVEGALKKLKDDLKTKPTKANLAKAVKAATDADKDIKKIIKWIKLEIEWTEEVTMMLRLINWNDLANDYPGGGGTNPKSIPPKPVKTSGRG